ncbi:hypothetical protein BDN70DRAFT_807983 [Pholiota conissans]|uniref:Beta-glucuronidase C-terminal domain-containing protein n=1 Tax=Pholiota conissans TaxID=109636 RepID=A0A9P5Z1A9_9AGAR|nr:hypothetical protein BDN70DRAFT_807983 [Pholiota conissans]
MSLHACSAVSPRSLFTSILTISLVIFNTQAASPLDVTFPDTPPASALANIVEDHFIGVSYELSTFDTLWGKSVDKQPFAMQNYMGNLAARMSKPLRIRIGGNGMDGSTYFPNMTTVLEPAEDDPYFNDIPVNFGPAFFDILNGMANKAGEMQFFIGLSMRTPDDFSNVQALGLAARTKLGKRLDSLFLGNEPDLYEGHGERGAYNITAYVPEIGMALDALEDVGAIIKDEKLAGGPTICCSWDLEDILQAGFDKYPYKYYSLQRYPKNACGGEDAENTNISYFATHSNIENYLSWQNKGIMHAQQLNVPVVLSEYNSVACGGSNISSTFATSLWSIDVGLKAASMNYSAVFLHTREFGVQYNLFDPPSPENSTDPGWRTGSPYYGALFLSEATYEGGTVIVDLNLNNSITSPNATVAGYALYKANSTLGSFTFINYGQDFQVFNLPSGMTPKVSYKVLTAPSVYEKTQISWANQSVGQNGILEGDLQVLEMTCSDGCQITLPGPSAALVVLGDGVVFRGVGSLLSGASTVRWSPHLLWVPLIVGAFSLLT